MVQKLTMLKTLSPNTLLCGLLTVLLVAASSLGQQAPTASASSQSQATKIQVNFLNTCHPGQSEMEEMRRALARVKDRPAFSSDFEIARGVTTLNEAEARAAGAAAGSLATPSAWVRIRREFPEKAVLTDAQYSLSVEGSSASEALALHLRDTREVLQILISDSVTGSPSQVARSDTPPDRIRIERFGKASIVLARCSGIDQAAYVPLFEAARGVLEKYRVAMAVKTVVPSEFAHLPGRRESKAAPANQ
jgi:hypothetical protein